MISSFLDIEIMDVFVKLFKMDFFKIMSLIFYKLGNFILTGFVLPLCSLILFDFAIEKYQNKKFFKTVKNNKKSFLKVFYISFLVIVFSEIVIGPISEIITYYKNSVGDEINVKQIDALFLSTLLLTGSIMLLLIFAMAIWNVWFYFYFVKKQIESDQFIKSNYIKPAITVVMFITICYLIIIVLKHASGRPLYMNVGWSRENAEKYGLDSNNSIENIFKIYGWNFFDKKGIDGYSDAVYHEWYQPNNIFKNWINWFTYPENVWKDYGDHYKDMDFPSGHMMSYSIGISVIYFFYFSKYYKNNKKFSVFQITYVCLAVCITMMAGSGLIIQMFHWPSDVFFSLSISPILFYCAIKLYSKIENRFFILN